MEDETPKPTLPPSDDGSLHPNFVPGSILVGSLRKAMLSLDSTTREIVVGEAIAKATDILENAPAAKTTSPSGFWFEMLMPVIMSTDFLANLEEVFIEKWVPKYGIRRAKILWHTQCGRMVVQHWFDKAMETATAIRKTIW